MRPHKLLSCVNLRFAYTRIIVLALYGKLFIILAHRICSGLVCNFKLIHKIHTTRQIL